MSELGPVELDITVTDHASAPIDKIAAKVDDLEQSSPAEVAVTTEGVPAATEEMDSLEFMRKHLSENPAIIDIQTDFASAKADLEHAEATVARVREKLGGLGQAFGQLGLGQVAGQFGAVGDVASQAAGAMGAMSGPMAAIGPLALAGAFAAHNLAANMKEAAEVKALNTKNVEDFTQALMNGATAADTLRDRLQKTGKLEMTSLFDGVKDLAPVLAKAGITLDQFTTAAEGGKAGIGKLGDALKAAHVPAKDAVEILQGAAFTADQMKTANERAAAVTKVLGDTTEKAGEQAEGAAGKQSALAGATDAAAAAAAGAKISTADYVKILATIPPDKRTDIEAAIDRGDLATAETLLNEAARTRTATININLGKVIGIGAAIGTATRAAVAGAGGSVVSITNVTLPAGARGVDALREVTGAARRTGTRYGSAAVSRARR